LLDTPTSESDREGSNEVRSVGVADALDDSFGEPGELDDRSGCSACVPWNAPVAGEAAAAESERVGATARCTIASVSLVAAGSSARRQPVSAPMPRPDTSPMSCAADRDALGVVAAVDGLVV
jgi:hypothetical protein